MSWGSPTKLSVLPSSSIYGERIKHYTSTMPYAIVTYKSARKIVINLNFRSGRWLVTHPMNCVEDGLINRFVLRELYRATRELRELHFNSQRIMPIIPPFAAWPQHVQRLLATLPLLSNKTSSSVNSRTRSLK